MKKEVISSKEILKIFRIFSLYVDWFFCPGFEYLGIENKKIPIG